MIENTQNSAAPTVSFVSLGCAKNLVDSEVLLGHLARDNFVLSAEPENTDIMVINTCGFLQASEKESLHHIQEAVQMKKDGKVKAVVVAGCLPQRYGTDFAKKLSGVDAVMGITNREEISRVARAVLARRNGGAQTNLVSADLPQYEIDRDRLRLTPTHSAYLRLSEGCNHTCAFCTIPKIRGKNRSKPMEIILDEAKELTSSGAIELNLIAQDTTTYGGDLYGKLMLPELLKKLGDVAGVQWIRLLYGYPTYVNDALIKEMASNPRVLPYLDMPIQHTRERMLRLMCRGITETKQRDILQKLRDGIPQLVLRTTIIVGFPQETEEDFENLLTDLHDLRFDRLGAFQFSREPGTKADDLDGHLSGEVILDRYQRVMEQQQDIAFEVARSWVGRSIDCLLEKPVENGFWEGRTYGDAPDIDPIIRICGNDGDPGTIRKVRVTASDGYDLIGELLK